MPRRLFSIILLVGLLAFSLGGGMTAAGEGDTPPGTEPGSGGGAAGPWGHLIGPGVVRFVPGTADWDVTFAVVADGWGIASPALGSVKVALDGEPQPASAIRFDDAPWVRAAGRVTEAEVRELKGAAAQGPLGQPPDAATARRLEGVASRLGALLERAAPPLLVLGGMEGVGEGLHRVDLTLDYQVGQKAVSLTERVHVLVAPVPREAGWFAADLHMHSKFSPEPTTKTSVAALKASLSKRGYQIGYVTDHTNGLTDGDFDDMEDNYPRECWWVSDPTTSMFPGVEMTVGQQGNGFDEQGDCLGYGVSSSAGLENKTYGPQQGIDQVNGNNPPLSSAAIAHPTNQIANPWEGEDAARYYGIELMSSPLQLSFNIDCGPVAKWRQECARLLNSAADFRPSVRTGSDYHLLMWPTFVTHVYLGSESVWFKGKWEDRWQAVSRALKDGRTSISRLGSLAYITADGHPVGSSLARAAGAAATVTTNFRPVVTGSYTLTLYKDNCRNVIGAPKTMTIKANTLVSQERTLTVEAGAHYYWLYVSGVDFCYTTPIYITGTGTPSTGMLPAARGYDTGGRPSDVTAADFDGNGLADMAVTNWDTDTVSVLMNAGDGSFRASVDYGTGKRPQELAAGDLDGNGTPDLVVTNLDSNDVSVLLNNGDGTFQVAVNYAAGRGPCGVAAVNLDGNPAPDLAVANSNSSNVSILINNGDGTFRPPVNLATLPGPVTGVVTADFDGNGHNDLAVSEWGVTVFMNNGDATFRAPVRYLPGCTQDDATVADFDGDGHPDIAATDRHTGEVSVLMNNGDGTFRVAAPYWAGAQPTSITAADFTGEGQPDLAVAGSGSLGERWPPVPDGHVSVLLNNGDATFRGENMNYVLGGCPQDVVAADFTGDGLADLAAVDGVRVWVAVNVGAGSLRTAMKHTIDHGYPGEITAADLDGNGTTDLAATNKETHDQSGAVLDDGRAWVLLNDGAAGFQPVTSYGVGRNPYGVIAGDFDGNGKADLAVANHDSEDVSVLLNNGDGTFRTAGNYPTGVYHRLLEGSRILAADLCGDGRTDLVVAPASSEVPVLHGRGDGTFRDAVIYDAGNGSQSVAAADFDQDGHRDLAFANCWGNGQPDDVAVLINKGDGTFREPVFYDLDCRSSDILAADFSGDGKVDLAVVGWGPGSVWVLVNRGDGTFHPPVSYGVGELEWDCCRGVAADLSGDGKPDLALVGANQVLVMVNNGDGTFHKAACCPLGGLPNAITTGDFNGDGRSDLAVTCFQTVWVLLNMTGKPGADPPPPQPPQAPTGLEGGMAGDGVHLSWRAPAGGAGVAGYEVYASARANGPYDWVKDVSATGCDVTGAAYPFVGGQRYYFQVRAYSKTPDDARLLSAPSNTTDAVAGPVPLMPPTALKAQTSMRGVLLTWRPPTAGPTPTGYRVYINDEPYGGFAVAKDVTEWSGSPNCEITPADFAELNQGVKYYFQVNSFMSDPWTGQAILSPAFATAHAVAGPAPPNAPTALKGLPSSNCMTLTWRAPTSGVVPDGYRVLAATSAKGAYTPVMNVTGWTGVTPNCQVTAQALLNAGLAYTRGAKYYLRLHAFGIGPDETEYMSAKAATATVIAGPQPVAPTSLKARTVAGGVLLTWKAPSGPAPQGYVIYISASSRGPYTLVRNVTAWAGAAPNYTVTAADFAGSGFTFTPGVKYYFRVHSFAYNPLDGVTPILSSKFASANARAGG